MTMRRRFERWTLLAALLAVVGWAPGAVADGPLTKLRVAIVKSSNILVMTHAIESGQFARQGLELDVTSLNNGAAIGSALIGGSTDIGFAATVAAIFARGNNQPLMMFSPLTTETFPGHYTTWFDAAGRLGPLTVAQLKGRTVAMNASGTSCELQLRANLMVANIPWDSIKVLILPFPQIPAALQLGNADVGCTIEPFHSAALLSPQIKASTVIFGTYPDLEHLHGELIDGFLAREDWLKSHVDVALRFSRAMMMASREVMKDPSILEKLIVRDLKVSADVAAAVKPSFDVESGPIREADIAATVDLMRKTGMLDHPLAASELIFPVDR